MKGLTAFCLMFCVGVSPGLAKDNSDAVPPGNWAKVESLTQGADISVKMVSGDRMEGEYIELDGEAIRLKTDGQERAYARKDIAEVYLLNISDPNKDGTLKGLGIGAGIFLLFGILAAGGEYSSIVGPLAAGTGAGVGALIGYAADNLSKGSELIYRARPNKQLAD